MIIVSLRKKKNNLYEVKLSDNTSLSFYDDTIIKYNLLTKKEISEEKILEINEYNSKIELYNKALKYITYKLRTKSEIASKLKSLNASNNIIEYVIERLEKEGYINNKLYLNSYINDQVNLTLNGPKKISNALVKLGFKDYEINEYLNEIPDSVWVKKINDIVIKKINSNHNLSKKMLELKIKKDLFNLGYDSTMFNDFSIIGSDTCDTNALKKEYNKQYKKLSLKYEGDVLFKKIKYNLYKKGFNISDIEKVIIDNKL